LGYGHGYGQAGSGGVAGILVEEGHEYILADLEMDGRGPCPPVQKDFFEAV